MRRRSRFEKLVPSSPPQKNPIMRPYGLKSYLFLIQTNHGQVNDADRLRYEARKLLLCNNVRMAMIPYNSLFVIMCYFTDVYIVMLYNDIYNSLFVIMCYFTDVYIVMLYNDIYNSFFVIVCYFTDVYIVMLYNDIYNSFFVIMCYFTDV